MTKDIIATSSSKPSKWASIPSLRLPEQHLKLDSRLEQLDQNAIARLYVLRSGLALAKPPITMSRFSFSMKRLGSFLLKALMTLLMEAGCYLAIILVALGVALSFYSVTLLVGIALAIVILASIATMFSSSLDVFKILQGHLLDLRPMPLTGLDFAIAHWGGQMLLSKLDHQFPAASLWRCCRDMEKRLEKCTGWTYYPSTFGTSFSDGVERGEVILTDEDGNPVLKDQFNVTSDVFTYSGRLDYLAALWGEYLEVWWPDQPWEGEARRAALPSRAQRAAEAGRVV